MRKALDSIKNESMSLNAASKYFNSPKGTLHNKIKGKVPLQRKMRPENVLKVGNENRIDKWILDKSKLGFPMHPEDVKDSVQDILKALVLLGLKGYTNFYIYRPWSYFPTKE